MYDGSFALRSSYRGLISSPLCGETIVNRSSTIVNRMTRIYTLVNQKGGVGKTTTAINLGAYVAQMGQRVLVVDLDPQANATASVGIDKRTVQSSTYEALLNSEIPASSILYNERLKLWLLPSS